MGHFQSHGGDMTIEAELLRRPVDWRWQVARALDERPTAILRRYADPAVVRARRLVRLMKLFPGEEGLRRASTTMPVVTAAYRLATQPDGVARYQVEARILAGEAVASIAFKQGIAPTVIRCFEEVFFDIRARLNDCDYVAHQVLGPCVRGDLDDWPVHLVWKFTAYMGGPLALDAVMDLGATLSKAATPKEVATFWRDLVQGAVDRYQALAGCAMPAAGAALAARFTNLHLFKSVAKTDLTQEQHRELVDKIDAMLKHIPFTPWDQAPEPPPLLMPFAECAAELRVYERMRLLLGLPVPSIQEVLKLEIGDPKNRPLPESAMAPGAAPV
jgi:Txe/YoeB family toxin of Txe-Axe toxin-antitoxin module